MNQWDLTDCYTITYPKGMHRFLAVEKKQKTFIYYKLRFYKNAYLCKTFFPKGNVVKLFIYKVLCSVEGF